MLRLSGNAHFGYSTQEQNKAPTYDDVNGGFMLNAGGFLYSPRLIGYQFWASYDRTALGYGEKDGTLQGISYGATFLLLQATRLPFSISYRRASNDTGGTLSTPYQSDGHSLGITGVVRRLPVMLSYHLGSDRSSTTTVDGHDFDYRSRTADVAISKDWKGFDISVSDLYLRSHSTQTLLRPGVGLQSMNLTDSTQTSNTVRLDVNRTFGSHVTMFAHGSVSKYKVGYLNAQANEADVASMSGGLRWMVTTKLDATFNAAFTRNAVNLSELLAASGGVSLPNPLPKVTALDTTSRTFGSSASYRATSHWTFGASVNYTTTALPASLSGAGRFSFTNSIVGENASALYTRRLWKFDYSGSVSGGLQSYSYASGQGGSSKVFNVTNAITGGSERILRYGVRFTVDRTDNPVFFSLLNSNDRLLDIDLARQAGFMRLNGRVGYFQRDIDYAGSTQHLSGLNFMIAAAISRFDLSASHSASDTNQLFFSLLSPVGDGSVPPGLLPPLVFSRSSNDNFTVSWRARRNLRFDSRYMRYHFAILGQNNDNRESWLDNSVRYHFGRFDLVAGFVHASGHTGAFDRRTNRFYFRLWFPFQVF